jgi:hypothetical protein
MRSSILVHDPRLQDIQQRREGVQGLKGGQLLHFIQRQQLQKLPGQCRLARGPGDGVVRAAPGRESAPGRCAAPQPNCCRRDPVLQMAGQPGTHHLRGHTAAAQAFGPLVGPRPHAAVDAGQACCTRMFEGLHDTRCLHQGPALRVEVNAFASAQTRAHADVGQVGGMRHEIGAGGLLQATPGFDPSGRARWRWWPVPWSWRCGGR